MKTEQAPTLADLEAARTRIAGIVRVTPVSPSETLSRLAGRPLQLKAENLQRTGSFKIRGAVNTIASLMPAERAAGVVAASAGNHGQAVAWAAREAGISATIFMPQDSPMAKVDATRTYGAQVELVGASFDESMAAAKERVEANGATFVHAFEDERVTAGRGRSRWSSSTSCRTSGRSWFRSVAVGWQPESNRPAGAQARGTDRGSPGREHLPVRRWHRPSLHDRGRHRGQDREPSPPRSSASCSTRSSRSRMSRSATRSCCCSSERSSSSRAPALQRLPPCSRARSLGTTRRW